MNNRLTASLLLAFPLVLALAWSRLGLALTLALAIVLGALLLPREAAACDATFILPRIIQRVMKEYRERLTALNFFALDLSATPLQKFGQEIIAQMPITPTAQAHTPGADLEADSVNVKTLMLDVPMRINEAAKVVFKVPTSDAVRLELDQAFATTLANAAWALGRYIVTKGLALVTPTNFTHEIVEPLADVDKETLSRARVAMNLQKAGDMRNMLAGSEFMSNLTNDPRIASGDYFGQRVEGDPYVTLTGLEGFQRVREDSTFPTANNLLAFGFDEQAILAAIRPLSDNFEMARRLGIPATVRDFTLTDPESGLSFTGYMWMKKGTQDIYVAIVVAFGVTGGTKTFAAAGNPENAAANALLDRSGLRIVSAATE